MVVGWKIETAKLGKKAKTLGAFDEHTEHYKEKFWQAMCDDFNAPKALGVVWEFARDQSIHKAQRLNLILELDKVLGLGAEDFKRPEISDDLKSLVDARESARANKEWDKADELRKQCATQGLLLMDTADGTDWYTSTD